MEEKLISVIIPTYNAEKTIERAICSVEDPAVEIVVVLDGEQPETERICRGALIAKYDEPDLIRFRYQKEPEGYDQYHYFADGKEEHYLTKVDFRTQIYPMVLNGYQLNAMWTNCIKKEYLEKIKLEDIGVRGYGEDLIVNLEIFSDIQNAVFSERICYRYITNLDSATKSRDISKLLKNLEECITIYTSLYNYLERWELDTKEYQKIIRYRIQKETGSLIRLIQKEVDKLQK